MNRIKDQHCYYSSRIFILLHCFIVGVFYSIDIDAKNVTTQDEMTFVKTTRSQCKNNFYYIPATEQLNKAEVLFKNFIELNSKKNFSLNKEEDQFKALGLKLNLNSFNDYSLTEMQEDCHGRGSYAVNVKANNRVVIQSPHSFFDTFTGDIADQLFASGQFFAAAWNSVSRKSLAKKTSNIKYSDSADLSRNNDSFMMRFSLAIAKNSDNARIVQLHGFSQKKRKTASGRTADIIISNGTRENSILSRRLHYCLKEKFSNQNILLYPNEIRELGATSNSIGKQLRIIGFDAFIHIEMSYSFRKKIKNNALQRQYLIQCLSEL